jgi:hypothetical protein
MPVATILVAPFAVGLLFQLWLLARQIRYLRHHTEGKVRNYGVVCGRGRNPTLSRGRVSHSL